MAVAAVQERPPATVETHDRDTVPALDIADPDMTRDARLARAAWRREHPEEWRAKLETLCHFDPDFIYDPAHEYDADSTTDPDYDAEGIHFVEFDADGVTGPLEKRAWKIQERGADTASGRLAGTGWEGDYERLVRFRPETIARANQATRQRYPVRKGVRPDMLVRAALSPSERERFMPKGVLRLDLGAPVPPLVMEVVSEGSAERDLNYKKHLYAAAGVSEYLVYDLGGKRWSGSPRELLMFRLEGGSYRQDPVADEYWSTVFNTRVRIMPDARERDEELRQVPEEDRSPPRFQWWDPNTQRWRDRESDRERLAEVRNTLKFLDAMLPDLPRQDRDLIKARWLEVGLPEDVAERLMAAHETPDAWWSLLLDDVAIDTDDTPCRPPDSRGGAIRPRPSTE